MPKKVSESYEFVGAETKVFKKESTVQAPSPSPGFTSHPIIIYPSASQLLDKQLERTQSPLGIYSKSLLGTLTSPESALMKPVPDPCDSKPQPDKKAGYLQLVVIIAVVVAFLLIIGLSVLLYFALSSHTQSKAWVGTAHELCQAKYGKCSMFAGGTPLAYPPNCTRIRCQFRCFYPSRDLNRIDKDYEVGDPGLFVSGKDGLICHSHSICKNKACVHTSTKAYDQRIDPKSAVECIKTMYGGTAVLSSGCMDSNKCRRAYYCSVKDQIQIGFRISCSGTTLNTCTDIHATQCGKKCDHVDNETKEEYMEVLHSHECSIDRNGKCFNTCKDRRRKMVVPDGVPCHHRRQGYCWRGRCFENERFAKREDNPGLIDESCYGKNADGTCYHDGFSYCRKVHLLDRYYTSVTRYGENCKSWDRKREVPKQYHKLRSYGCILHDKKMPWCYSTNPNVVWNYCYNLCPHDGLDHKDPASIRIMTFSFPMQNVNVKKTAKTLAADIHKINPDIILTSPWPSKKLPQWKSYLKKETGGEWKACGGLSREKTYSIFIRKSNGSTIKLSDQSGSSGCIVTKDINGETPEFAVISANLNGDNRSTGKFCKSSRRGRNVCKGSVPECEETRIRQAQSLLAAVEQHNDKDIILGGSFNQPSHLDWTPEAAHLHCNTTYNWTISKLMQQAGYKDSYRYMWKDPSMSPGITFSPLKAYKEYPQDRLDYIYFRGSSIEPIRAETYPAAKPGKGIKKVWPADRYAVVVDYRFK